MDNEQPSYSRLNRYQKKRNNTRWLLIFVGIGSILIVVLVVSLFMSGSGDEPAMVQSDQETASDDQTDEGNLDDENADSGDELDIIDEQPGSGEADEDTIVEQHPDDFALETLPSDDENVLYAYTSTWEPVPTEQGEPHEISWEQDSVDWKEMMKAAELATGVHIDEIYHLWVSGNGVQSVIATFSNSAMNEHFRVYITWVEGQGWMPERVDVLNTHDKMDRFVSSSPDESEFESEEEIEMEVE